MTKKSFQVLAAVAAGLVLLLLFVERTDKEAAVADGEPLLPELVSKADDITQIDIAMPDEADTISIRRDDGNWVVDSRAAYPADVARLRQLVLGLAEAKILEEKTANPANYGRLGVADAGEDGAGTSITLSGDGFSYAAIIGDAAQGGLRYARVPEQATSYLIDQDLELPSSAGQWLASELIDIPTSDVKSVRIEHADGETIVIEKTDQEQTDFNVRDIPEGRSLNFPTVGNNIARALEDLSLTDVSSEVDAEERSKVTLTTWDGLEVTTRVAGTDDQAYVAFNATAEGEDAPTDKATEINQRLDGWWYVIPGHKSDLLQRRWEDILSDVEDED